MKSVPARIGTLLVLAQVLGGMPASGQTGDVVHVPPEPESGVVLPLPSEAEEVGLGEVQAGLLLPGGFVAVADAGTQTIHLFDREGRHVWSRGGIGDGPEEFRGLVALRSCGGGSIHAVDQLRRRVATLDRDGRWGEVISAPADVPGRLENFLCDGRGGRVFVIRSPSPPPTGVGAATAAWTVVLVDAAGVRSEIGPVPGGDLYFDGQSLFPRPLGRTSSVVLTGNEVLLASGEARIAVYDWNGTRTGDLDTGLERREVGRADIQQFVDDRTNDLGGSFDPRQVRAYYRDVDFPDRLPAYERVIGDPTGGIWVERFDLNRTNPTRWRILAPESPAPLEVELPPGRQLLSVGSDGLLVLEEDALGVPSLRLYPRVGRASRGSERDRNLTVQMASRW